MSKKFDIIACGVAIFVIIAAVIGSSMVRFNNVKSAESYTDTLIDQINSDVEEIEQFNDQAWTAIIETANQ